MTQAIVRLGGKEYRLEPIIEKAKKLKHKRITVKSLAKCVEHHTGMVPAREVDAADLNGEILFTVLPGRGPILVHGAAQLLLAARKREIKIRAKEIPADWLA